MTLEVKNILMLNSVSVYPLVISVEGVVTKNFSKYLQNIGLTKKSSELGKKQHRYTRVK